jgi:pyruvate/2-oxoglutarate dehydrogenase complex dihydrolipoamide acyltransferase (E2) component
MSSPIRPTKDANPALMYAPPWVRDQDRTSLEPFPLSDQSLPRGNGVGPDFEDRAVVETRRRRTLEPEWLPEPPLSSGPSWWRITLRAGGVFGLAALVALAFIWIPGVRRLTTDFMPATSGSSISGKPKEPSPSASSAASPSASPLAVAIEQRAERLRSEAAVSEQAVQQTVDRAEARGPEPHEPAATTVAVAAPPPAPAPAVTAREPSPQPPDLVLRQVPRDELASMLQRADDFIKSGDLSSARLLLQRAAEAGDARAALTLASTFDPNVLKALGFQYAAADVAKARLWYERAMKFGSAEAPQRLQQLTTLNLAK